LGLHRLTVGSRLGECWQEEVKGNGQGKSGAYQTFFHIHTFKDIDFY
jgi:hypothetical protein